MNKKTKFIVGVDPHTYFILDLNAAVGANNPALFRRAAAFAN